MLHLKKKRICDGHLTNITNKQAGKDRQCTPPDTYGLKICEKLTQLRWSKGHMLDNVTVLEEHTSGTPWGVRYTRLRSTAIYEVLLLQISLLQT